MREGLRTAAWLGVCKGVCKGEWHPPELRNVQSAQPYGMAPKSPHWNSEEQHEPSWKEGQERRRKGMKIGPTAPTSHLCRGQSCLPPLLPSLLPQPGSTGRHAQDLPPLCFFCTKQIHFARQEQNKQNIHQSQEIFNKIIPFYQMSAIEV